MREEISSFVTQYSLFQALNNGGERKIGASEEKKRVGIGDGGAGTGVREEEGEPVRLSLLTLFRPLLDNWISAVKMFICQHTEIVLKFLARVVRANSKCEQVTIVMSKKSFFQSRCPPFKVLLILQEKRNMYRNKDSTRFCF